MIQTATFLNRWESCDISCLMAKNFAKGGNSFHQLSDFQAVVKSYYEQVAIKLQNAIKQRVEYVSFRTVYQDFIILLCQPVAYIDFKFKTYIRNFPTPIRIA